MSSESSTRIKADAPEGCSVTDHYLPCHVCATSSQGGCFEPLPQSFISQQPITSPVSMDTKLPSYPSQFTPAAQVQFPSELATVGPQGLGFVATRGAFPGVTAGMGLRPGMTRPQGVSPQLRLAPNQLRLQLQQRLQGPQQVCAKRGGVSFLHLSVSSDNTLIGSQYREHLHVQLVDLR